jgi:small-conductance mechanosensitive channel
MLGAASFLVRVLKFLAMVISLYIAITSVFALFAPTRTLAQTLIGYVWNPLKNIIIGFIQYIPSLFMIAVTVFVTRYILRMVKFFSTQIQRGKLVISGFYADWAQPTYQILRVLIFALTAAVIYPLLPNSGSEAFKGISVFAGLLISFGSSSAISNMVAGIVLTYTRSFKVGDFIKLGDVTGFVEEKSGIVTRVRTPKNEYVTFPNTTVLNSAVTNYNTSLENDNGLVIHTELTEGYATPWKTVHQILIEAALKTQGVQQKPAPYVLQKALDDFYCRYEINAFTKDVERLARIYSELYQNIQDGYKAAGLDLTTPHIGITRVQAETHGVTN